MKKEYPWSFRIDEPTHQKIAKIKEDYQWETDSQVGRNILAVGIHYLINVKEFEENPESEVEINQKMLELLENLSVENNIKKILKDFDQNKLKTVLRLTYLESKEREREERIREEEIKNAEREAVRLELEEQMIQKELEKTHRIIFRLKNGKGMEILSKRDRDNKAIDKDGNIVDLNDIETKEQLPPGIEFVRYYDEDEISFIGK